MSWAPWMTCSESGFGLYQIHQFLAVVQAGDLRLLKKLSAICVHAIYSEGLRLPSKKSQNDFGHQKNLNITKPKKISFLLFSAGRRSCFFLDTHSLR